MIYQWSSLYFNEHKHYSNYENIPTQSITTASTEQCTQLMEFVCFHLLVCVSNYRLKLEKSYSSEFLVISHHEHTPIYDNRSYGT